ncbi:MULTISPECIES: YukJ family protein [Protofrankia]|nr:MULTISPECIES: YukJ family protein [Protofrankia]
MPLRGYGVLVGQVVDERAEGGTGTPRYQIHLRAAGDDFRIAVNVLSSQQPADLLFVADEDFRHPVLRLLQALPDGFTTLSSRPGGPALDYIRGNLFNRLDMRPLPATQPGPDNDLADRLHRFVIRAIADPAARVYAFGQRWGPEPNTPDKIFGFLSGNGIHDVHMNQGNSGRFRGDDGVWHNGA